MGRHFLLRARSRARQRLRLARRDGNEDDVLGRETHAAIERARDDGDLLRQSTAVSNMGSLMDALAAERDDIAAGVPTGGTLDAEAYVLVAQRQGACARGRSTSCIVRGSTRGGVPDSRSKCTAASR